MGWGSRNIIFIGLYWRWCSAWHTNHSYRSDSRVTLRTYNSASWGFYAKAFLSTGVWRDHLWSPQRCGIFQAGVEEEENQSIKDQVRSGASLSSQDRSDYLSPHDWHPQPGTALCCQYIPRSWALWEGGFQQMLNYQAGCWRQFPLLGRVWEKSDVLPVQFSSVWHFILQNYSTLRLRQAPIHA